MKNYVIKVKLNWVFQFYLILLKSDSYKYKVNKITNKQHDIYF